MSDANIKQLIGRLEALEAPCRKVDMLIETLQTGNRQHPYLVGINIDDKPDAGRRTYPTPRYTASIDAAMTLVPRGNFDQDWGRSTRYKSEGFKLWQVRIALETVEQDPQELGPVALGEHDTPAIALCIAALRAQEASHDGR
jgi:hypothetical protein